MLSGCIYCLTLSVALLTPSHAQSVDTAGLVGVSAVAAGTAIIILIIWVAICYNLYKDERDFCKFKKRLRQRREQYRRYRERQQIRLLAQRQRARARRDRPSRNIVTNPFNQHVELEAARPPQQAIEAVRPPQEVAMPPQEVAMPRQEVAMPPQEVAIPPQEVVRSPLGQETPPQPAVTNTKRPPLSQLFPPSPPLPPPPPTLPLQDKRGSDTQQQLLPSSPPPPPPPPTLPLPISSDTQEQPSPTMPEETRETHNMETHYQTEGEPKTGFGEDWSESVDNATNGRRVHFSEGTSDIHTVAEQGHHDVLPHSIVGGAGSVGRYSPKFLREEEEVDICLDESSAPPRYSWLFSDKGERHSSNGANVWRKSLVGRRREGGGSGRRDRGRGDAMAAFGQLSTWPQFTF